MQKSDIISKTRGIKTVEDLAALLTQIKTDEFGSNKHAITAKKLLHFSNSEIVPNRYKIFHIAKKNGGVREIHAPVIQLKVILYVLNVLLKALYHPNDSVMGFTEGRSIVDNASMHVGHHYVFNIDLENFFPSVSQGRVWARIQHPPFNFSKEIASIIAGLCCAPNEDGTKNVLPQGAATSPLLTNAICDNLDRKMKGVAKRFGLHYSRYADDMTFSSMHNVFQEDSDFRKEISSVIMSEGFTMNDNKTRLHRDGQRQEVTGLTVNSIVNVTKKYVRDLRCILHVWEKEGYAKAYSYFYPKYKHEKGYIKKGEPVMENVISGKLQYLRMVKGDKNECYQKLQNRYDKLQLIVYVDSETDRNQNYTYVQPYSFVDFENSFETKIELKVSSKKKLVGQCQIGGIDKIIAISKSTQNVLCPNLSSYEEGDSVESDLLKGCFVTLCRSKGKNFWLITKHEPQRSKCLSIQNVNLDVDSLLSTWDLEGLDKAVALFNDMIANAGKKKEAVKKPDNSLFITKVPDSITDEFENVKEEIANTHDSTIGFESLAASLDFEENVNSGIIEEVKAQKDNSGIRLASFKRLS